MSVFTPAELAQFVRDGFVIARGLASRESCEAMKTVAQHHLAQEIQPIEYESDVSYPGAPASREAPGGRTVRRLLQAFARDPAYRDFATAAPVAARLRQLLGERIELSQSHHNCVMTKNPAYSSATGWHQDIRYWFFEKPELISTWLALGTEHEENGCLWLVPGSHRTDFHREQYDNNKFFRADLEENLTILQGRIPAELDEGDMLFFHCRTLHAAGRNQTAHTKLAAVFTYHAGDNRPLVGTRSASLPEIELP